MGIVVSRAINPNNGLYILNIDYERQWNASRYYKHPKPEINFLMICLDTSRFSVASTNWQVSIYLYSSFDDQPFLLL